MQLSASQGRATIDRSRAGRDVEPACGGEDDELIPSAVGRARGPPPRGHPQIAPHMPSWLDR